TQSGPDTLIRIGMFAQWFELRLFDTYESQRVRSGGVSQTFSGVEDLEIGMKLALTPQEGVLPETAILLEMSVPSGAPAVSDGKTLVTIDYLYSWELVKDKLQLSCESLLGQQVDPGTQGQYWQFAQSMSLDVDLTEKLGTYVEWYVLVPNGADTVGTQHY